MIRKKRRCTRHVCEFFHQIFVCFGLSFYPCTLEVRHHSVLSITVNYYGMLVAFPSVPSSQTTVTRNG